MTNNNLANTNGVIFKARPGVKEDVAIRGATTLREGGARNIAADTAMTGLSTGAPRKNETISLYEK